MRFPRLAPLLAASVALAAAPDARGQDRPLALEGATIETVAGAGRIESGVIVLRGGKIEAVGPAGEVDIPEDARVVDAAGRTIMPGVVEPAYSYRTSGGGPSSSGTVIIGGQVVVLGGSSGPTRSPTFTRVADAFDPYRDDFAPLLRSGLTHLNLTPDDYGQAAVVRNTPDEPDAMLAEADGRLFVSVTNSTASLDVIRKGLESAKRPGGTDRDPGESDSGSDQPDAQPSSNPSRELWRAVADGEAPLIVEATGAAAILYLLDAIEEYKEVRVALSTSAGGAYPTLDRLAGRDKLTLMLLPAIETKPDTRDRINLPRMAHEEGIDLAFTQGSNRYGLLNAQDTPLFDVGVLIATGLPRDVALEALTRRPAELVGLGDSLGRLEAGMSASLLIFDGDPFDPYSRLRTVIIEGRNVYDAD